MARADGKRKAGPKTGEQKPRRIVGAFLVLLALLAAAVAVTDRRHWPEGLQENAAVIRVYALRDAAATAVKGYFAGGPEGPEEKNAPLAVRALAPAPKEPGYTPDDRAKMEELIREEGMTP